MPGGTESLVHAWETIEGTIRANHDLGVLAVIDVDFQNAFPSWYHEAVDLAIEKIVPELQSWSKWCQDICGVIFFITREASSSTSC